MKITIDTKEDSPEEIKKAIKMLSSLIGEETQNALDSSKETSPDIFNMFENADSESKEEKEIEDEEEQNKDIDIDIPRVEEYR
ncbi:hypothetical protein HYX01_03840 [Candidatus Woesearchaeota archaeon]|nr:hypothetical protein [Candidatus Woesearchaeota archaeon]